MRDLNTINKHIVARIICEGGNLEDGNKNIKIYILKIN